MAEVMINMAVTHSHEYTTYPNTSVMAVHFINAADPDINDYCVACPASHANCIYTGWTEKNFVIKGATDTDDTDEFEFNSGARVMLAQKVAHTHKYDKLNVTATHDAFYYRYPWSGSGSANDCGAWDPPNSTVWVTPPHYYALDKSWISLGGSSEPRGNVGSSFEIDTDADSGSADVRWKTLAVGDLKRVFITDEVDSHNHGFTYPGVAITVDPIIVGFYTCNLGHADCALLCFQESGDYVYILAG